MNVESGLAMLRRAGLSMQASWMIEELPDILAAPLAAAAIDHTPYRTFVMLGQAGTRLWETIAQEGLAQSAAPFDNTSHRLVDRFVTVHADGASYEVVYPGHALLPLGRLAELAGWGRPSPLGLTINDEYGLWLAHRVAFLIDADVTVPHRRASSHPCDTCVAKPCVAACPVGAVDAEAGFDVDTCATFRVAEESVCAHQCLARNACPVGTEHRYGPEQMRHHYESGLVSIRRFYESDTSE